MKINYTSAVITKRISWWSWNCLHTTGSRYLDYWNVNWWRKIQLKNDSILTSCKRVHIETYTTAIEPFAWIMIKMKTLWKSLLVTLTPLTSSSSLNSDEGLSMRYWNTLTTSWLEMEWFSLSLSTILLVFTLRLPVIDLKPSLLKKLFVFVSRYCLFEPSVGFTGSARLDFSHEAKYQHRTHFCMYLCNV